MKIASFLFVLLLLTFSMVASKKLHKTTCTTIGLPCSYSISCCPPLACAMKYDDRKYYCARILTFNGIIRYYFK